MKIELIAVDKLREPYLVDGCRLYLRRLRPIMPVDIFEVRASTAGNAMYAEGETILQRVGIDDELWALDASGHMLASIGLAAKLDELARTGKRKLCMAIGGANGLSAEVRRRADFLWSLSKLTFLHEMTRVIVLEQLYRAAKINRNEPYHR